MKWQATLYITFVDFEKAFNSVHRESLWKIMESYGIPCKIIHMVQMLYEDSECAVLDEGEQSEWFKVKTGVKQGDVMSGFIFLIVVDWIMRNTTAGNKTGIRWNFTSKLEDLDFADDIALMSSCYTHVIMLHTHVIMLHTHVIMLHTHVIMLHTHVIMLHTHANKDKTTESICSKDRTKNK